MLLTQHIRARVVDEDTRKPLIHATASLINATGARVQTAGTDSGGYFQLPTNGPGKYQVTVERIGYATPQALDVVVTASNLTLPAFVMRAEAVALDPVEVTSNRRTASAGVMSRASHILNGERLARLEQSGASPLTAVRELGLLRVREWITKDGQARLCI